MRPDAIPEPQTDGPTSPWYWVMTTRMSSKRRRLSSRSAIIFRSEPVGVNNATGRYSRTADGWPDITLVLGYDNEDVEQEAKIIKPLGYHLQAMTPTQCEVVGTYVRGR